MTVDALARTQWLYDAKYGISFIPVPGNSRSIPITPNTPVWEWEQICNDFDLAGFVKDAVEIGAGWVLVGVGQTNGYYCTPNAFYCTKTGTKPGQYTTTRDLISEMADALALVGIKTMVYCAAEGPTGAPKAILDSFPCPNDQAPAETRVSVNAMITEWSLRWGTKISGWWLDGCFVNGYTNGTDGQANLAAIIAACKIGNPASIVACNASVTAFKIMHTDEDYLAGEEPALYRNPYDRLIDQDGKLVQWHIFTYLGDDWGQLLGNRYSGDRLRHYTDWFCKRYQEPVEYAYSDYRDSKYTPDQLAHYVKNTWDRGGASTYDVATRKDLRIDRKHIKLFAETKKVMRENAPLRIYKDLNRYKPTDVLDIAGYHLPTNGEVYFHWGTYATDGVINPERIAQAGGQYAWSLQVDYIIEKYPAKVVCTFAPDLFPTHYKVAVSRDRINWTVIVDNPNGGPGRFVHEFPPILARWIVLGSVKPDGPDQRGGQMAVMGFESYSAS